MDQFFHNINRRLNDIAKKQDLNESVGSTSGFLEGSTGDYSAKKARAGKDIGKPGKMFSKIAKSAGERYGSKERGEKVAGAVLAKLRAKESVEEKPAKSDTETFGMQAGRGYKLEKNPEGKWDISTKDKKSHIKSRLGKHAAPALPESDMEEGTRFTGNLMKARAAGLKKADLDGDGDMETVREGSKPDFLDPAVASKLDMQMVKLAMGMKSYLNMIRREDGPEAIHEYLGHLAQLAKNFTRNWNNTSDWIIDVTEAKAKTIYNIMMGQRGWEEFNWERQYPGIKKYLSVAFKKAYDQVFGNQQVAESGKPDYIDLDKDGNKKETMKKAAKDKKRSAGTAFDPEVAKGMFSKEKDKTRTGHEVKDTGYSKRYTKQLADEPEADDEKSDRPKTKGRPKGSKRAIGAKGPTGKSKLMKKDAIKEMDVPLIDKGEFDREGEMAKQQIHTIMRAAKKLHSMLGDDDNLPEWVQKKITLATNYIDSVTDYMASQRAEAGMQEPIAEKAVSQQQQKFMGMVHAMQKGEKIPGASKELKKVAREMPKKAAKDYAATKHAGLPKKVKEEGKPDFLDLDKDGNKTEPMKQAAKQAKGKEATDETAENKPAKKGGFEFGKGVYESMDMKLKQILSEGMNISVNMNTGPDGQPSKNITVSADGDDAESLAALLKMAGLGSGDTCPSCGKAGCGCEELDENSPDWPTNTETSDDEFQYSGGLNGPKDSGQTTDAPPNLDPRRQGYVKETVDLERTLFRLYQNYKAQ